MLRGRCGERFGEVWEIKIHIGLMTGNFNTGIDKHRIDMEDPETKQAIERYRDRESRKSRQVQP